LQAQQPNFPNLAQGLQIVLQETAFLQNLPNLNIVQHLSIIDTILQNIQNNMQTMQANIQTIQTNMQTMQTTLQNMYVWFFYLDDK
jgi:hypothetical protein